MISRNPCYSLATIVVLATLVLADPIQEAVRAYPNPLNGKRVDLFFVIDQRPQSISKVDFIFLKTAIASIASGLNSAGSDPCFASYFYGPTATVSSPFGFCTKTAALVQSAMDLLIYPVAATSPTTLAHALNAVSTQCSSGCRSNAPRVTFIISSNLDGSAASVVRQLERNLGMVVIVLSVGNNNNNTANAGLLASYPQHDFIIPVGSYSAISTFTQYITSIISDVPRLFPTQSTVSISLAAYGTYHALQINTAAITTTNEAIVMLASSCPRCYTYASLSELIPSADNSPVFAGRQFYVGTGSYSYISYFRVPRNTIRVFVSFVGDNSANVYFTCDVISLPATMAFPVTNIPDLQGSLIG